MKQWSLGIELFLRIHEKLRRAQKNAKNEFNVEKYVKYLYIYYFIYLNQILLNINSCLSSSFTWIRTNEKSLIDEKMNTPIIDTIFLCNNSRNNFLSTF